MIDCTAVKNQRIIIPFLLQKQILWQLHSNYMGIEKMSLFVCESVYWLNMNTDIKNTVKKFATCLDYQQTQLCEKMKLCDIPSKPREVVGADIFSVKLICYCLL